MNKSSSRVSAAALAAALMLGTASAAFAEGAAAGGNESAAGETRYTPRGRDVGEGRAAIPPQDRSIRANPAYDSRRELVLRDRGDRGRVFNDDRDRFDRGFSRRGDFAYYNGHRGYRSYRRGYHEHNGWWFPLAAFAAGAVIAGSLAAPPPVVAVAPPNPHVDWCARTYRSYNPYDNTFQPYRGPRAYCISPYS